MSNLRLSEKKKIRRIQPCGDTNEIYLIWVNFHGGIENMLFEAHHGVMRSTGSSLTITNDPEDYINGRSFVSVIKKDGFRELSLVKSNADLQTREGLETILTSNAVFILLNGLNAAWDIQGGSLKLQEVHILDGQTDIGDTDEELKDFELRIRLQPMKTLWR